MNNDQAIDCIQVTLTRSPLYGFGIAINDDNDNQSLIISDVIKNGPGDGKLLPNDRIINVNGHPVVRYMEYTALKLIRQSTDFVHLIVERQKHPELIIPDNEFPIKCLLNKTRKDEKFGIILDCRFFIKKISYQNNEIQEGDEVIKINEIPIDRLTLQEAQKLIDKTKDQLVLYTIPNKSRIFERSPNNHPDLIRPNLGTRYVSFSTETSSIGIRLAGGNKYGLFICEIQPNSVAYKAGLFIADKIFSVNNIDFTSLTREEAVLCLMNMKTMQVNMIVSNLQLDYEQLLADIGGDSFYIRAHFTYNSPDDEELSIRINDVFHVTDTLYNGEVGHWVVTKLNTSLTGAIPNQSRAQELVDTAPSIGELIKAKQSSFKGKLRSKFSDKRSRSVLSLNYFKDDSIFDKVNCWKPMINSKFSPYERVRLKSITIIRPVVLLGSLADIARDRLINEYPDQFELPQIHIQSPTKSRSNIIKLQSIKNVIQKNRHCLLDVTPSAIEQLNYAECYPIVIYFKATDRRQIKQIRNEYGKLYQKSSRRLFENSERVEHIYSYLFTSIIKLDGSIDWYDLLKSQIELQQEQMIWMNHDQLNDNDLLKSNEYFISTRLSDSDSMNLQRVASDPIIFQKDDENTSMQNSTMSLPSRRMEMPLLYQRSLPHSTKHHQQLNQTDTCLPDRSSSRQPLMAPKLRTINSIERLSSSDSNGSIRKNFLDKSTMTMAEKNTAANLYATWNKTPNGPNSDLYCSESLLKQKMCSSKKHNHTSDPLQPPSSIQKPRVYDNRNLPILSSSSGSSILSLKDKNLQEVGETKSYSIQDGCNVIGSAHGIMDYYGGKLSCPLTGVSLLIPIGAIPKGIQQEIYFQVCQDNSHIEKFNGQLLSPIVICGPYGIQFEKAVELILPHSAGNDAEQLSLILHDSKTNSQQQNKPLLMNGINHVTNSNVSILINHF